MKIRMYVTTYCNYCVLAKKYLHNHGFSKIEEINIENDSVSREKFIQLTQRKTVPQIFIAGHHVGGYDDLVLLNKEAIQKLLNNPKQEKE